MNRMRGFTLIELLVVIAIISILAAIVVPKVQGHILRARMVKAESEIRTIEIAVAKLLSDTNKSRLADVFDMAAFDLPVDNTGVLALMEAQTDALYKVLRQGRDATLDGVVFAPGVKERVGTSYMPDLGFDAWDQKYWVYAGPWEVDSTTPPTPDPDAEDVSDIPFRCWRLALITDPTGGGLPTHGTTDDISDINYTPYVYDALARADANLKIPGNPGIDGAPGFPAPRDLPVYILSFGVNQKPDQLFGTNVLNKFKGGGDDINNWDKTRGWQGFYAG